MQEKVFKDTKCADLEAANLKMARDLKGRDQAMQTLQAHVDGGKAGRSGAADIPRVSASRHPAPVPANRGTALSHVLLTAPRSPPLLSAAR